MSTIAPHRRDDWPRRLALLAAVLVALIIIPSARAQAGPPAYQLQYLGPGSPAAINNSGTVVGARLNGSNYEPLVSVGGGAWSSLPVLPGAVSVFPTDINDAGVIVGVSYNAAFNAVAVRWTPAGGGYTIQELPRLPGDPSSYATAINNLGQIVGARGALGYIPAATTGWLYSDALGVVDLFATYGWAIAPRDLNDHGLLLGSTERLNLNTGALEPIPAGPPNYQPITGVAINNSAQMVGTAALSSVSLNVVSVFRYSGGAWSFIAGTSRYTTASSLNNLGDIGFGELGAGLYLDGLGTYPLGGLLDPAVVGAGWVITGSGAKINDGRQVATIARNTVTGQTGGVLLTPAGTLPPPPAPANLAGVAHPATSSEPFNAIILTWDSAGPAVQSYQMERRVSPAGNWTPLSLTPPGLNTSHTDTTVGVGVTYDYRVRAVGVAGSGPWSNIATVTAPATPLDTTPPTVTILTPANGATVSGVVAVAAQATDNVGVATLEISYWNQYLGQEISLGSVSNSGALSANWDTRSLTPATYTLWATAADALGNWTRAEATVTVTAAGKSMRVSDITLSGTVKGSQATITGLVYIKDGSGQNVANATVAARWTLPNGNVKTVSAKTNSVGRVRFVVTSARGTYTLTVTNVTRNGYTFDAAGSVLSKSITK